MRNPFKKEPTIEFFSLISEVSELAPIASAQTYRPDLMNNAARELSQLKKDPRYGYSKSIHTAKCPGIYNLAKHGWVMTTYQDITITTNGDGQTIRWTSALDQKKLEGGETVGDAIGFHGRQQYSDYVEPNKDSLPSLVKFFTPWRCVVPDGYYLYEGPLPYSDEDRFTTLAGFYSQEHGVAQMNVQVLWHVMDGTTIIKAGTPIAHYMLIPKEQPKLVVRPANENDVRLDKITKIEIDRKFVSNRTESKCLYSKLFKKFNK